MKINPSIFKSYDIRGVYPDELNEETAYQIGKGFVEYTKAEKIVVGRDGRLASPSLFKEIVKGITEQGTDVYDIGQVPTECLYFAVGNYEYEAGIMITASHNPKEYNGFKMIQKQKDNMSVIRGKDMLEIVGKGKFPESKEVGKIEKIDIWQDYFKHSLSLIDINKIKPFKIAIDASNGMAGEVMSRIKDKLPIEITPLNFEVDGNFPSHAPNPLLEGSIDQISKIIKDQKLDFGFIFDGDADRVFLIDEKGEFIRADITLLLLAKYFLNKTPGTAISYNANCSKAVPKFIEEWGGKPIKTKVGFVNVREGMLDNNGSMGGELSGHYSFKDNFALDSGFIAFLILLQIISESKEKLSDLVKDLSIYVNGPEINFEVKDKEAVLDKIKQEYIDGKQDFLDGITIEYDNWWFNVRASQTEPVLRLTIEADTKELFEAKKKELTALIEKV